MKTEYPILLVHGLGMKDMFFMKSFGRIDRILRIQGYTVFKSRIDAFGSVETNARQLSEEIAGIVKTENCGKVNIIAHSKGGLDARRMLEEAETRGLVASLTTICTPHLGSPIASFILRFPRFALKYAAFWVNTLYRVLGDKQPDSLRACEDLKRAYDIPIRTADAVEGVFCQSFSANISKDEKHTDFIMGIPAMFSRMLEKNSITDGLVPRDSAIFGTYKGDAIDGSVSHTEIVDFMVKDKHRDRIYKFYSELCEDLMKMGF